MKRLEFEGLVAVLGTVEVPARIVVIQDTEHPEGVEYSASVEFNDVSNVGVDSDAFRALARAREQFELTGWKICVQGASQYCYPSGMLGDTGALYVYRFPKVLVEGRRKAVKTFAPADQDEIVTVEEQESAHRARMNDYYQQPGE